MCSVINPAQLKRITDRPNGYTERLSLGGKPSTPVYAQENSSVCKPGQALVHMGFVLGPSPPARSIRQNLNHSTDTIQGLFIPIFELNTMLDSGHRMGTVLGTGLRIGTTDGILNCLGRCRRKQPISGIHGPEYDKGAGPNVPPGLEVDTTRTEITQRYHLIRMPV